VSALFGRVRAPIRRREEDGLTLVELALAGLVGVALLTMAAVATTATVHSSRTEVQQGVTTEGAILAVQEVQQTLSSAWTPGSTGGVTSQCAGGADGQSWVTGNGPFVSVSATDIVFCGFRNNSSIAYTYELHFTHCTGTLCTLELDQLGAPGCSPSCRSSVAFVQNGVSEVGIPFGFYTANGGAWVTTATLSQIDAVQVTLVIPALNPTGTTAGNGTQVERLVVLCNAASGAC